MHSHHNEGHGHSHIGHANERRVFWAMVVTALFMGAEFAGGLISGSLALIADAGHMLTDAAALALAWGAFRIARRPPDQLRSYGYDRFQVLAAFTNGLVLLALVAWILKEAFERIMTPAPIMATPMLVIAVLGLFVNIASFRILSGGDKENINIQGAMLHIIGDLLGSVAAIFAAVVILWTGWTPIDPILSVLVALLILRSAWVLVKKAAHILMEGVPDSIDVEELKSDLVAAVPGLVDAHHIHVWLLTAERPLLTMHATVDDHSDTETVMVGIKARLLERHGIDHSTIQVESGACADEGPDHRH